MQTPQAGFLAMVARPDSVAHLQSRSNLISTWVRYTPLSECEIDRVSNKMKGIQEYTTSNTSNTSKYTAMPAAD